MLKGSLHPAVILLQRKYRSLQRQLVRLREKERHLSVINSFASALLKQRTTEEIAWSITNNAIAKLGFEDCVIYLLNEEDQVLEQVAAYGPKNPRGTEIRDPIVIPVGQGIVGTVAATGQAELIGNTAKDSRYIPDDMVRLSELAVPISSEGKIIGVIDSEHSTSNFFNEEHLHLLETIAALAATSFLQAQAQKKLRRYREALERQVAQKTINLQEMVNKLQSSNEDLEAFAYAASHDLREPIRTIASFLHLIKRRSTGPIPDETEEYLDYAIDGAYRMNQLLSGLQAYATLNDNQLEKSPIELNHVVQACLKDLSYSIKKHDVRIDYPEDLPIVQGYPTLLHQLLQNLLANAIKFHRPGTTPHIQISYCEDKEWHHFAIEDNGIGIDPEFANRIFDLYTRLNNRKEYGGTGLGLSICKKIVLKHGGKITAAPAPSGQGARISFCLPR